MSVRRENGFHRRSARKEYWPGLLARWLLLRRRAIEKGGLKEQLAVQRGSPLVERNRSTRDSTRLIRRSSMAVWNGP